MSVEAMNHVWKTSQHKGATLLVLLAIADHAHPDGSGAYPSVATLARMGRTTPRHITRILTDLEKSGELVIERHAGPNRTHRCRIPLVGSEVMPWADARRRPEMSVPTDRQGDEMSTPTPMSGEPSVPSSDRSNEERDGSGARNVRTDKMSALHRPPSYRSEEKRVIAEAEELWKKARKRLGTAARFTDAASIRGLRISVRRALSAGHSWLDLSEAITARASDPKANPWYIDEWTRVTAARRIEAEHEALKAADRHKDADLTEADWRDLESRYPGLSRREIAEKQFVVIGAVSLKKMPSLAPKEQPALTVLEGGKRPEWPKLVDGPGGLVAASFRCNADRCSRQGWKWAQAAPDAAPIVVCRHCFDQASVGSAGQRSALGGSSTSSSPGEVAGPARTGSAAPRHLSEAIPTQTLASGSPASPAGLVGGPVHASEAGA